MFRFLASLGAGLLLCGASSTAAFASTTPPPVALTPTGHHGYWSVTAHGQIAAHAGAPAIAGPAHVAAPIVAITRTPTGRGYWLLARNGSVYARGDAHFYGEMAHRHLHVGFVAMAATANGHGYWLLAQNGQLYAFGAAHYLGTERVAVRHVRELGLVATAGRQGYWEVRSNDTAVGFGSAKGAHVAVRARATAIAKAGRFAGRGRWLVAADGHLALLWPTAAARRAGTAHKATTPHPGAPSTHKAPSNGSTTTTTTTRPGRRPTAGAGPTTTTTLPTTTTARPPATTGSAGTGVQIQLAKTVLLGCQLDTTTGTATVHFGNGVNFVLPFLYNRDYPENMTAGSVGWLTAPTPTHTWYVIDGSTQQIGHKTFIGWDFGIFATTSLSASQPSNTVTYQKFPQILEIGGHDYSVHFKPLTVTLSECH